MWKFVAFGVAVLFMGASVQADTVSCDGKRAWQRELVQRAVHGWFEGTPDPDDLIQLMQAEHGIAACAAGFRLPARLHTTALPYGLSLDQLGAVLLSNELQWSGLVPSPEAGLAGEFFEVRRRPASDLLGLADAEPAR